MKRENDKNLTDRTPADRVKGESFLDRVEDKVHKRNAERRAKGSALSGEEFLARSRKVGRGKQTQAEAEPALERTTDSQQERDEPARGSVSGTAKKTSRTAREVKAQSATAGGSAAAATKLAPEATPPQAAMPMVSATEDRTVELAADRNNAEVITSQEEAIDTEGPLFTPEEAENFHARWNDVQSVFVDDPGRAVKDADALVDACIGRFAELLHEERENLRQQWNRPTSCTIDQFRQLLRRYHSFIERLLTI